MTIAESIQSIDFLTALRESALMYPIILGTHLACIAFFGGMILMTDLRLLGVSLKNLTITEVVGGLRPWKRLGGVIMITCGLLLGSSEAVKYAPNPFFWTKMTILALIGVHALVFRPIVYNNTEELDRSPVIPSKAKLAAYLSLILWIGMICMGRLIAYYEPKQPAAQASLIK
ncbi:MAG TPA: DUF6644 family protein [Bryobacteraceae bacterium]|jgi:hypothetical protein